MKKCQFTYWSQLIVQLREKNAWSQEMLAEILETDQSTVSRWECGDSEPRSHHPVRNKLEQFAKEVKLGAFGETIDMVKSSPFPMILVNKQDLVVAASASSGFQEGKTCFEQTPQEEQTYLRSFEQYLDVSGFWQTQSSRMDYEYIGDDGVRRAIVTRFTFWGEVYALVQKSW